REASEGAVTSTGCGRSQTRTFTATDGCGNAAVAVARTVTCPARRSSDLITASGTTLTLGCNPTAGALDAALGTATATDTCSAVTPVASDSAVTSTGCGRSQTRTFNATDACGNAAVAVARTVTWTVDVTLPVITASGTTLTLGCNPTAAAIAAALGTATATDTCSAVTPAASDSAVTSSGCGRSQTRTFNATDACGNAAVAVARTVTWTVDVTLTVRTASG